MYTYTALPALHHGGSAASALVNVGGLKKGKRSFAVQRKAPATNRKLWKPRLGSPAGSEGCLWRQRIRLQATALCQAAADYHYFTLKF